MKLKLLTAFLFLISIQTFAQDQKWSIEANYQVIPIVGLEGDDNIIDLGLKYRFADFKFVHLGLGANVGFSKNKFKDIPSLNGESTSYYFQPRVFAEFSMPGVEKLRLSVGLGYSIVNSDVDVMTGDGAIKANTSNGGFNFNLGLTYDITKRFFIQGQYDVIILNVNDEYSFQGEVVNPDYNRKQNNIKLGVGFRF